VPKENLSRIGSCDTSGPRSGTRLGTSLSRLWHSLQTSCGSLRLTSRTRIFSQKCTLAKILSQNGQIRTNALECGDPEFTLSFKQFQSKQEIRHAKQASILPLRNRKQLFADESNKTTWFYRKCDSHLIFQVYLWYHKESQIQPMQSAQFEKR